MENRARQTAQIKSSNKKLNSERNLSQISNFSAKNNHTKLKPSLKAREITHHADLKKSHEDNLIGTSQKEQNYKAHGQEKEYDKSKAVTKPISFERNNTKINEKISTEKRKLIRQKTSINPEEKSRNSKTNDENRNSLIQTEHNLDIVKEEHGKIKRDSSKKVSFIENQSQKNETQIDSKSSIKESDFEKIAAKTVNDANNLALVTYVSMVLEKAVQTVQSRHSELALERIEESSKEEESVSENFDSTKIEGKPGERVSVSDTDVKNKEGRTALNKEIQTDNSIFKKESKSNLSRSNLVQSSLTNYLEEDFRKNPKTKKFDSIIMTKDDDAKNAFPKLKRKMSKRSFSSSLSRPKHDCLSSGEHLRADVLSKKRENYFRFKYHKTLFTIPLGKNRAKINLPSQNI